MENDYVPCELQFISLAWNSGYAFGWNFVIAQRKIGTIKTQLSNMLEAIF